MIKNLFHKNYKIMILILILILFVVLMYYPKYKEKQILYRNSQKVDVNDLSFSGLLLLDSDLEHNNIFLAGETHGSIKSIEMKMYLLKYFVEKGNIKYILLECGYSVAELLNEYLETGNEEILNEVISSFKGTMSYSLETFKLYKEIYNYNLSLSNDKKIRFVGIDIEHQPELSISYINLLVSNIKSEDIKVNDFIKSVQEISKDKYIADSKLAIKLLEENEESIQRCFGEKYFNLELALRNLSVSIGQSSREKYIISNFIKQYEYLPKGKYFGQLGSYHTKQDGYEDDNGYKPFAYYLDNEYENTIGKVISIEYDYKDSTCYTQDSKDGLAIPKRLTDEFFPKDGATTLFKLNGIDKIGITVDENHVSDYFQYIITFTNSPSATEFK